ncbi:Gyp8p [Sugiyamaella lignohabitans]|uniref:Gyp8p n=1 Tax=Sugiyamaella lignohabitans TaxID=796027 RepID=A0A167DNF0_9ASCO|nr:Gyp8p [Sugiyamaella lignohabitans]ANB13102.1 Gyp8p [Sugiyamaella lignohabitans]
MSWIEMNPTDVGNSIFTEKGPLSATKHNFKISSIETAYRLNDLELLQTLAKSRKGLVNNELRRKVWPVLLGLSSPDVSVVSSKLDIAATDLDKERQDNVRPVDKLDIYGHGRGGIDSEKDSAADGDSEKGDNQPDDRSTETVSIQDEAQSPTASQFPSEGVSSLSLDSQLKSPLESDSELVSQVISSYSLACPECKDKDQVKLDVDRSFVFYPQDPPKELAVKLLNVICTVLADNPDLCYYQGYHDIAQVILLVHETDLYSHTPPDPQVYKILEAISLQMLRDFMTPGLSPALLHLDFIPLIVTLEDAYLGELIRNNPPYYALSAVLTLFSHHVHSLEEISVVFDYIIASQNMAMPIYMYIALIISQKAVLKKAASDPDNIHSILSTIADDFDGDLFDQVLKPASKLAEKYPLSNFKEQHGKLSEYSVLKATLRDDNSSETVFAREHSKSVLHLQAEECKEQMKLEKQRQEVEAEERRRAAEKNKIVKKSKASTRANKSASTSALLLGRMMVIPVGHRKLIIPRSLLGLSICIGVIGVIASGYKYDTQFSWFKFFTRS